MSLKSSLSNLSLANSGQKLFSAAQAQAYQDQNQAQSTLSGASPPSTTAASADNGKRGIWTAEQDDYLRGAVERHGAKNWKKIALEVPGNRSHIQCLQRWSKVLKPGLVRGAWTESEDALLTQYVGLFSKGNWVRISEHISGRTAKQCRERWMLVLDPSINKESWTKEEDAQLLILHEQHGNAWAFIAKQLEGRTENSVKCRFKSLIRKRDRSWTVVEDSIILRAKAENKSWEAIAALLPNRSKHAAKMRWNDLMNGKSEKASEAAAPMVSTPTSISSAKSWLAASTNREGEPPSKTLRPQRTSAQTWISPAEPNTGEFQSDSFRNWLQSSEKFDADPLVLLMEEDKVVATNPKAFSSSELNLNLDTSSQNILSNSGNSFGEALEAILADYDNDFDRV